MGRRPVESDMKGQFIMIRSMTGFGRAEIHEDSRRYTVEIKTVNHRYLEANIKMPKALSIFESSIRSILKEYLERGKVDMFITYEDSNNSSGSVKYNSAVAHQYFDYLNQMSKEFGLDNDIRISGLSRFPEVFTMEEAEVDEDTLWKGLEKAVRGALAQVVETRTAEGENLKKDLIEKLDDMLKGVAFIEERAPGVVEEYRSRLTAKIHDMLGNAEIDEARIVTEVTIYADKISVDEEVVRLRSHIETMKNTIEKGGHIGRKLDFIAQEMNREANTTLSKANDLATSDIAIELKTSIEKVREQIQNIE